MKRQQWALTIWLLLPLAIVALLCWAIAVFTIQRSDRMATTPPVGAGGGATAGANAIGELLAGNPANKSAMPREAAKMVPPETLDQGFVLVVEDGSGLASDETPIYLAGNHNGWNPGDAAYRLVRESGKRWKIVVPKPRLTGGERLEFKFTRGDWAHVEVGPDLADIENRRLPDVDAAKLAPGQQPVIELKVPRWQVERPGAGPPTAAAETSEVTGTIKRLQVQGGAGTAMGQTRDILVWLPPGYEDAKNANRTYPVLYLHDGQNIFSKPPTAPAEWHADEIATDLIGKGMMQPIIIVGVPHSGNGRLQEYLPVPAIDNATPQGERHVQWLLNEVMPRVERAFRVKTGPESTGVGGSSLGAVISVYAATTHADKFGLVLAESLPLRTGKAQVWDDWLAGVQTWPRRVPLGMGGAETGNNPDRAERNRSYVDAVKALDERLKKAGLGADRRLLIIDPAAEHTESAWAKRLPQALVFLSPPPMDS